MNYTLLTEKDLEARYNYSSSKLKTVFDSKETAIKIDRICTENRILDEEKKIMVFQLTAMVLLGVLHVDDLAKEIDQYLTLNNYKFSKAFADEITKKIFEPVRSEIEKNYRPIASATAKNLQTQSGEEAVKMTPAAPTAGARPVSLGQLQSKDAFAKPLTPPNFSSQPKPMAPSFKPPMPAQKASPTPAPSASTNNFQSKNPPLDLSQKHAVASGLPQAPAPMPIKSDVAPTPQAVKLETKKESPTPEDALFEIGDQIKMFDKSQNELVEVLKKREETAPANVVAPQNQTPSIKPQPTPIPSILPKQGPVMIHQETTSAPIRPNTDFKLNFPQAKSIGSFGQKMKAPNIAKIEIGGTTERQLEGVVKSSVIQPPKVVHYNAFQTPMDRTVPTPPQPPMPAKSQIPTGTPLDQMSQSPFVKTGKNGYGDMRMEPPTSDKLNRDMRQGGAGSQDGVSAVEGQVHPKIKMVDFVDESLASAKPKKGWFASLFGRKEKPAQVSFSNLQPAGMPSTQAQRPTPPSPLPSQPAPPVPPKPPTQAPAPMTTIQNIGNFAGTPKTQISQASPKTQDIKPLGAQMSDSDIIDLNTFDRVKR